MSNRPEYPPIPSRLQQIDELTWLEHYHIEKGDQCFYLWERTSGARYDQYPANQLISNFQIPMRCRPEKRWYWKEHAIRYAARALSVVIPGTSLTECVFVPIPPSTIRGHPDHDPRLTWTLNAMNPKPDFREIIVQRESTASKEKQIKPEERAANYEIDSSCCNPGPRVLIVFDDVLSGGSHFKATKMKLSVRFPGVPVMGLFLARSPHPEGALPLSAFVA